MPYEQRTVLCLPHGQWLLVLSRCRPSTPLKVSKADHRSSMPTATPSKVQDSPVKAISSRRIKSLRTSVVIVAQGVVAPLKAKMVQRMELEEVLKALRALL